MAKTYTSSFSDCKCNIMIRGEFINNMESIIPEFEKSLFNPLDDVGQDLLELGIDSLIGNEVIRDIPIVSSLIGVIKVGYNIHEGIYC